MVSIWNWFFFPKGDFLMGEPLVYRNYTSMPFLPLQLPVSPASFLGKGWKGKLNYWYFPLIHKISESFDFSLSLPEMGLWCFMVDYHCPAGYVPRSDQPPTGSGGYALCTVCPVWMHVKRKGKRQLGSKRAGETNRQKSFGGIPWDRKYFSYVYFVGLGFIADSAFVCYYSDEFLKKG